MSKWEYAGTVSKLEDAIKASLRGDSPIVYGVQAYSNRIYPIRELEFTLAESYSLSYAIPPSRYWQRTRLVVNEFTPIYRRVEN